MKIPNNIRQSNFKAIISLFGLLQVFVVSGQEIVALGRTYIYDIEIDSINIYRSEHYDSIINYRTGAYYLKFFQSNKIACIYNYVDNYLSMNFFKFHPNGNIWIYAEFYDMGLNTTKYYFDENGNLFYLINYKDGFRQFEYGKDVNTKKMKFVNHLGKNGTYEKRRRRFPKRYRIVADRITSFEIVKENRLR